MRLLLVLPFILLSACAEPHLPAAPTPVGAGCEAFAMVRPSRPSDASFLTISEEWQEYVVRVDEAMTLACR